ncbi:DUF3606 domain-containing protein [Pedobacter africanus]|uniref:DUF3606 domain-containing protein n=1 Tax=Pedobacter africanus TaxID=151894 RepID=A0A1W2CR37_9SPHI|nr:DUF3606 domain-containing protein [Pedobacter africanus]SMC87700.1 Protein of unknown function [Pedobacter africanus]
MEDKDKYTGADFIDMDNDYEVLYWTSQLKVTNDELKEAVREVGNKIELVKVYLNKA